DPAQQCNFDPGLEYRGHDPAAARDEPVRARYVHHDDDALELHARNDLDERAALRRDPSHLADLHEPIHRLRHLAQRQRDHGLDGRDPLSQDRRQRAQVQAGRLWADRPAAIDGSMVTGYRHPPRTGERGMTLIELMIALLVSVIGISGSLAL